MEAKLWRHLMTLFAMRWSQWNLWLFFSICKFHTTSYCISHYPNTLLMLMASEHELLAMHEVKSILIFFLHFWAGNAIECRIHLNGVNEFKLLIFALCICTYLATKYQIRSCVNRSLIVTITVLTSNKKPWMDINWRKLTFSVKFFRIMWIQLTS